MNEASIDTPTNDFELRVTNTEKPAGSRARLPQQPRILPMLSKPPEILASAMYAISALIAKLRHPARLFDYQHPEAAHPFIYAVVFILVFWTTILFGAAFVHDAGALQLSGETIDQSQSVSIQLRAADRSLLPSPSPLRRLLFAIYWGGAIVFASIVRRAFLVLLGEPRRRWRLVLALTAIGFVPLIFAAGIQSLLNHLWLATAENAVQGFFWMRTGVGFGLLIAAWLCEAAFCVSIWRTGAGILRGRAFLLWLAPWFLFGLLLAAAFFVDLFRSI